MLILTESRYSYGFKLKRSYAAYVLLFKLKIPRLRGASSFGFVAFDSSFYILDKLLDADSRTLSRKVDSTLLGDATSLASSTMVNLKLMRLYFLTYLN